MVRRLASLIVMAVFVAGSARTAGAQESASAGIAGQVLDATRAAVPGATVTVINAGTNAQRVALTDTEGRFTVPNLPGVIGSGTTADLKADDSVRRSYLGY